MKRKRKSLAIWALIVLVLVLGGIAVYLSASERSGTLDPRWKDFSIKEPKKITKIFIADKDDNTILLKKQPDSTWQLNNGFRAQQKSVELLLSTMKNIRVKAPVPRSMKETVLKNIAAKGKKVEIYMGEEEPAKIYYFGTPTKDHYGTYMLLETPGAGRSPDPYVTHVPGNYGFLTPRFFTDEQKWRHTGLFTYDPRNIRKITVRHHKNPGQSFSITYDREEDAFALFHDGDPVQGFDAGRVRQYVTKYKKIHVERYISDMEEQKKDSILNTEPVHTIKVVDNTGKVKTVEAYHMDASEKAKDAPGKQMEYDLDRMYGWVNGEHMASIQNYVFDPLFEPLSKFKKQGAPEARR